MTSDQHEQRGSSGVRINFNFNSCRGPILLSEGLEAAFRTAHGIAEVRVLSFSFVPFADGTSNFHADLATSHCSGGTYLVDRHAAGEVHMCHEDPDRPGCFRDNTALAWALVHALKDNVFKPADFRDDDLAILAWQARPLLSNLAQPLVFSPVFQRRARAR